MSSTPETFQPPSVNRSVHYHPTPGQVHVDGAPYSEPCAAMVTRLWPDGGVDLTVFPPSATPFCVERVSAGGPDAKTPSPGTWTYAPFVPGPGGTTASKPAGAPFTPNPELLATAQRLLDSATAAELSGARALWDAHRTFLGGVSAVTGAPLPTWEECATIPKAAHLIMLRAAGGVLGATTNPDRALSCNLKVPHPQPVG